VDLLLRSGPGLRILATSRETLGVAGEVVWSVPALSIPPAPPDNGKTSQLVEYEAIQLFVDRAALVRPGFTLTADNALAIAEICRQLDGNPLAIELAAARVKVLDVPTIVQRLDDRFRFLTGGSRTALPRQQTLQALVDWSYGLLLPEERRGFARLSVFAGGWTLEAAEAVLAGDRSDAPDVLDLLTRLVDKSLVVCFDGPSGGTRYQLLETLRHYGRQRLDDSGETATWRARHARYYLALLEPLERDADGASRADGPGCLHDELDNLHAALEWALSRLIRVDERLVDPGDAERSFRQCLEVYRELGVRAGVALALAALAGVVQPPARAARLAGAAEAILENEIERGGSVGLSELRSALARLDYLKRDLTATRAWTEGRRETLDEVIATALVANPPLNGAKVR
jgi:non-specific serine/threonine protein kinase